ncbi:MAG TPA: beta-1,6-N-acetylglucosaminyltransferase, partial [Novosphingobium sp.]|nr:beta-1,6-N-acetylglucosaminyltransferase [Novosphingobium sp.]
MRMAYLIIAHHDRAGLARLIGALLPPGAPDLAVIHADARSDLWVELRENPLSNDPRVHVLPDPVPVIWGHWSQVEAARRLIAAALRLGCDFAHTLSGVDWPVADRTRIIADIEAAPAGTCFVEAMPRVQEERMQVYRLDTRWLRLDPRRDRLAYAATWELRRLSRIGQHLADRLGMARSRPLGPWHKGSCWWSLPERALTQAEQDLGQLIANGRL